MELLEVEERTESELRLKEQELELAKVELEAWNDEVDLAVSTVTPNVLQSCGPVSSNVCEIAPATSSKSVRQNAQRSAQRSTHVTYTNVDYALNSTRVTKPTSHQPVRVSFSTIPININTEARPPKPADETPLKSAVFPQPRISFSSKGLKPSASSTSQAPLPISNMQSTTQSSLACGPSYFASPPCPEVRSLRSLRRDRPVPPVVIQKFDGDPMNYWLFVRQCEAHVLGKVDNYELFPLLYQNCESNVQHKFNHLSNQLPSASFEAAWNILFDEYGHPHEIARCCEERLKSAQRVPEDDRERLKSLAQLLEKCCVSLEHIGEASTLDSMHVMMNIINKLPVELKRAWIEYAVKIERQAGHRAKFANLSAFLTGRSRLANSIFGRETFPGRSSKPRRESTHVVSEKNPVSKDLVGSVKCHFCNGDHKIGGCKEFSDRTFDERYDFARLRRCVLNV